MTPVGGSESATGPASSPSLPDQASAPARPRRLMRAVAPVPGLVPRPRRRRAPAGPSPLLRILVVVDALAVGGAWTLTMLLFGPEGVGTPFVRLVLTVSVVVAGSLGLIAWQRLYRARVCSIRMVEISRLVRVSVITGAGVWLLVGEGPRLLRVEHVTLSGIAIIVGSGATLLFLVLMRGLYRSWLNAARRAGRFGRPIIVVGTNEEALELYRLIGDHPELGFRPAGVVGDRADPALTHFDVPYLGPTERVLDAVDASGANGVLIAASAVPAGTLNRIARELLDEGVHVQLSAGVRGIGHQRLVTQSLASESLFYIEPIVFTRTQLAFKRLLDLTLATLAGIVAAPVLLFATIAIKIDTPGPVLFRQRRIGRDGRNFTIYKLRTMIRDAEGQLGDLRPHNDRRGPLFKLERDPRVTRVGRFLRAMSLDELPQLVNVLRGDMSLVGPRPALPGEAAEFDDELLARLRVRPGITGLWQVEARDNPSFGAYRRLDLFYVENWSVALDVAILVATVQEVVMRGVHLALRRSAG